MSGFLCRWCRYPVRHAAVFGWWVHVHDYGRTCGAERVSPVLADR